MLMFNESMDQTSKIWRNFLKQIKEDISGIISSPDVFIFEYKTNDICKIPPEPERHTKS